MKKLTIEKWIRTYISDRNLYVLREKRKDGKPGRALNVSYTPEGLKYTLNKQKKLIACKNARLVNKVREDGKVMLLIEGNTLTPDNVVIERFVPVDHDNVRTQLVEFVMVDRALKMLYHVDDFAHSSPQLELVYTTDDADF
jgi:hypothetical protein